MLFKNSPLLENKDISEGRNEVESINNFEFYSVLPQTCHTHTQKEKSSLAVKISLLYLSEF